MPSSDLERYFDQVIKGGICGDIEMLLGLPDDIEDRPGPLLNSIVNGIDAVGGMAFGFVGVGSEKRSVEFMKIYMKLPHDVAEMVYGLIRCGVAHEGVTKLAVCYWAPKERPTSGNFLNKVPDDSIWINVTEFAWKFLEAVEKISRDIPSPLRHLPAPRHNDPALLEAARRLITRELREDYPESESRDKEYLAVFNPL